MRIALEHLDARGLVVDLPSASPSNAQRVVVRQATALAGLLEHGEGGLSLRDVTGERLVLDALHLVFGAVGIDAAANSSFAQVKAALSAREGEIELDLDAHGVHATELDIAVGELHIRAEVRFRGFRLWVRGSEGRLRAEHVTASAFRLDVGDVHLSAAELVGEQLHIAWGAEGFRLDAASLEGPSVGLALGTSTLDASDVVVQNLAVHEADVSFAAATIGHAELATTFPAPSTEPRAEAPRSERAPAAPRVFDYALLDGLSGRLDIDLTMDMTVPIIGSRKAVHKLRLPVEEGSVDYRELENDLSALEESLLDFSVRENTLVLERGIPLLPTRGLGKPLLIWDLSPRDVALAHRRRVRLAVLPNLRLAEDLAKPREPGERESSTFSFALRRLSLENIDLSLTLNAVPGPFESAIRKLSFAQIAARGAVHHLPDGGIREGEIRGELKALETTFEGLALGTRTLDIGLLYLGRVSSLRLGFSGLRPSRLLLAVDQLALTSLALRGRAREN